jgi:uncharacterized protein
LKFSLNLAFLRSFIFLSILFSSLSFAAKEVPFLSGPVIDETHLLKANEKADLESYIRQQQDLMQLQVWIFSSLEGDSIERISYAAAQKWKLGREKKDNGLLLTIAVQDRRMRFEVGRGLEGSVPDILAGRILDYVVRPAFKEGRFYEGIQSALEQAVTLVNGGEDAAKLREGLSDRGKEEKLNGRGLVILFLFFVVIFIMQVFSRRRYGTGSGFYWGGGGGGWGSSGGSSWGGGSGWSGGGGSFGGGGSSSSW